MNHKPTCIPHILENVRDWNIARASENIHTANSQWTRVTDDVCTECKRNARRQLLNAHLMNSYLFDLL